MMTPVLIASTLLSLTAPVVAVDENSKAVPSAPPSSAASPPASLVLIASNLLSLVAPIDALHEDSKAVPVRAVSPPSSAVSPPASSVLIASTLLSLAALIVALHEDSKAVPIRAALLLPWPPPPSSTRGASTAGDSSGRGDGRALVRRGRQGREDTRGGGARGRTRAARERGAVSPGEDDSSGGATGAHPRHRGEARENHGSIAPPNFPLFYNHCHHIPPLHFMLFTAQPQIANSCEIFSEPFICDPTDRFFEPSFMEESYIYVCSFC